MKQIIKSPYDTREYAITRLDNNMETLFISDDMTTTSHVAIIINAGFMMDGDVHGLAHFLEHMLFMGTEKYPNVDEYMNYITSHGGHTNAFTSSVNTCYFFSINSEYLEGAIDRMVQFFITPLFKENTIDKEINAVNSEFNETKNNFLYIAVQMLKQLIDINHPFHQFDIGSTETLSIPNIRDKLFEFYRKYYIANNMRLIIMDKRPINELQKIVQVFGNIKQCDSCISDLVGQPTLGPSGNIPVKCADKLPIFNNPIRQHKQLKFVRPMSKNGGFNSNDVWIYWTIPSRPTIEHKSIIKYFTYLLRQETENSLMTYLRTHTLINSLGFHTVYNLKEYYLVCMTLNVTNYGMHHIDILVKIIHNYISKLVENMYAQNDFIVYNKCQNIAHKFSEKKELSELQDELLSNICENGLELPIAVKYNTLPCYYDKLSCSDILNYMSIDNANIVMASQLFIGTLKKEHEIYGINYDVGDFKYGTNITITDATKWLFTFNEEVIPKQLMVYANKETFTEPIKINVTNRQNDMELWYAYKKMILPKACLIIEMVCPNIYKTVKSYVATNILMCHIMRLIDSQLYDTRLLGNMYNISFNRDIIHIEIYGFNDKLQYHCKKIIDELYKFSHKDILIHHMNNAEFLLAKNIFGTNIEFMRQHRISDQLYDFISMGIFEKTYSMNEILKEFNIITHNDMIYINFYECSDIKCFINGNIPKQLVTNIYDVLSVMKINSVYKFNNWNINIPTSGTPRDAPSLTRSDTEEKISSTKYIDIGNVTSSEQNNMCCVIVCLGEVQKSSIEYEKYCAFNMLFDSILHTDFFTSLRSQQQLGYTVKCVPREFGRKNILITQTFSIVSQKYQSKVIEQRIFEYFNDAYKKIMSMKPYVLSEHINSCVALLNDIPNNILDETIETFKHISAESYKFDHRKRVINELQNINIDTLQKNYDEFFMSKHSRKIIIYGK